MSSNSDTEVESSRKRSRDEEKDEVAQATKINSDGTISFSLQDINKHLICGLCSGYFKEPYTITECLHTYCKSCLFYAVSNGCYECQFPGCVVYIGRDPLRVVRDRNAVHDRTLQDFIDRTVFPEVVEEEKKKEQDFYQTLGIGLKPEFAMKLKRDSESTVEPGLQQSSKAVTVDQSAVLIRFTLLPESSKEEYQLPILNCPCMEISGKFQIKQLKKYLLQKLGMAESSLPLIEIICNGVTLGSEMSLSYVQRMLWHQNSDMALTYKTAKKSE